MAAQRNVGLANVVTRLGRVLGAIKHVDFAHDCLGGNKIGILGHVAGAVDLPRVVDGLNHLDARGSGRMSSNF